MTMMKRKHRRELDRARKAMGLHPAGVGYMTCQRLLRRYFRLAASHGGYAGLPDDPIYSAAHVGVTVSEEDADRAREIVGNWAARDAKRAETNAQLFAAYTLMLQGAIEPGEVSHLERQMAALAAKDPTSEDSGDPPPNPDTVEAVNSLGFSYPKRFPLLRILTFVRASYKADTLFTWHDEEEELEALVEERLEAQQDHR